MVRERLPRPAFAILSYMCIQMPGELQGINKKTDILPKRLEVIQVLIVILCKRERVGQ
jgi:hypothetical protein